MSLTKQLMDPIDFHSIFSFSIVFFHSYGAINCQFYQHDQNFAEKPVTHNLLHAISCLIDSLYLFSK